jgi:hypothetical protein
MSTAMVLCLTIEGKKMCVEIPYAFIEQFGPPHPDNDPLSKLANWIITEDPNPQPWKTDLPILATIDHLVSLLNEDKVQRRLGEAVEEAARQVASGLPPGVQLDTATMQAG